MITQSEPCYVPCCTCIWCYEHVCNAKRNNPIEEDDPNNTSEWMEVYNQHVELREKQIHTYKQFTGPVRKSTVCRAAGCRRVFGRRGLIFCTEGCCEPAFKKGDPSPPFKYRDIDDENDASVILQRVLGDPPINVTYRRWQRDDNADADIEEEMKIVMHHSPPGRRRKGK